MARRYSKKWRDVIRRNGETLVEESDSIASFAAMDAAFLVASFGLSPPPCFDIPL